LPDGALLLSADVSGHDIRAAFVSAYFQGLARGLAESKTPTANVLDRFNRYLIDEWNGEGGDDVPTSLAVTAITIDRSAGNASIHNHGCPPVFHLSDSGEVTECHPGGGGPLGWFDDETPVSCETSVPLAKGGWLVLWTDGLGEHADKIGVDPWALADILDRSDDSKPRPPELLNAPDDVMLIRVPLRQPDKGPPPFRPLIVASYHGGLAARIDELQAVWESSLKLAARDVSEDRILEIILCLREAVLNALVHGCGEDPALQAHVSVTRSNETGELVATVRDPGPGYEFDWETHNESAALSLDDKHRGLAFIHGFADEVEHTRRRAWIGMKFKIEPTPLLAP
jgi:anti-sigma regulatory factor (Ser/Thr protein kinase)